ncbi:hypothetical protein P7K49_022669, partial [Saguinus oedipus]
MPPRGGTSGRRRNLSWGWDHTRNPQDASGSALTDKTLKQLWPQRPPSPTPP